MLNQKQSMTESQYKEYFGIDPVNKLKAKKALKHALDIRKFEIELYWKRAAYFWALIVVAFTGYFAILGAKDLADKEYLAYIVSCIGFLFTWAWFLVNRGSKYYQENWENHVDMLEDVVTGPLYKTILHRPEQQDCIEKYLTGPEAISVSKTNQWVSLFTLFIWITLLLHAFSDFSFSLCSIIIHAFIALITIVFAVLMYRKGKTHQGSYVLIAEKRYTKIERASTKKRMI